MTLLTLLTLLRLLALRTLLIPLTLHLQKNIGTHPVLVSRSVGAKGKTLGV